MNSANRPLALVTGASSGIGLEFAKELSTRGFDVAVAAEDAGIDGPNLFDGDGTPALAVRVDLAEPDGVEQLAARVRQLGRPVDVLAVNAGVGVGGEFVRGDLQAHLKLVDLNVRSAVHLTRLMLPGMVERGDGAVLFTSSIAATMPGPYQSTYNASKSFLLSFAEALRTEVADSGVAVTALMPGPTDTNFFERAGIEDTKLGQSKKDDPRDVARDGLDALFKGKDHVVAGSLKNRAQVAAAKVLPDRTLAATHGKASKPGSAT
jgi:short-subunit dehydrogenase